jgi:ADP-heptose:LPS heptosyltransferase/lauroyl/myristoyl acyltransferase
MFIAFMSILGWLVARTPRRLLQGFAVLAGEGLLWFAPGRRRLIWSNLHHAFPGKPSAWYRRIARSGSRQLVETGLLSLATPFLTEARIRRIAQPAPSFQAWAADRAQRARPTVFGTLHLALWESQTWMKLLCPIPLPEFGIIFRPLDHAASDAFVKRSRERFGMRLLSRREGFAAASKILRGNGCVGVLFDQNAGMQGDLTLLFGRVCSTTELPGLFAEKFGAEVRTVYPRRTGFWRVEFESHPVPHDGTASGVVLALNQWLEQAFAADTRLCASWLWAHNRWRHQDIPAHRLRLRSKRDLLAADLAARGLSALPRRTRLWIRLPNWLGDVAMALPLIRAIRASRPDAEITAIARDRFAPFLQGTGLFDAVRPLPPRGPGYWRYFWRRRRDFPDLWLAFTNSWRGDLEGWLAGAGQRFGIRRPGRWRPLLTHAYALPPGTDEATFHQVALWENYLRHFGLEGPVDFAPLAPPEPVASEGWIGLIPGSENNPAKRWPVAGWREVIASLPQEKFLLLGTAPDRPITAAIAAGQAGRRILDLAGQTDLPEYLRRLQTCRLVITNDTGGMHLASALGIPVVALFGPTNPIRTGPVYSGAKLIVQPPACPAGGGRPLTELTPARVLAALHAWEETPLGQRQVAFDE